MKKTIIFAAAILAASFANAQFAKPEEAKAFVSGKSVEYVRSNGQTVQMDFKENGELTTTNKAANRITKGTWSVDQMGQVCQAYADNSNFCFLVLPSGSILWTNGVSRVTIGTAGK